MKLNKKNSSYSFSCFLTHLRQCFKDCWLYPNIWFCNNSHCLKKREDKTETNCQTAVSNCFLYNYCSRSCKSHLLIQNPRIHIPLLELMLCFLFPYKENRILLLYYYLMPCKTLEANLSSVHWWDIAYVQPPACTGFKIKIWGILPEKLFCCNLFFCLYGEFWYRSTIPLLRSNPTSGKFWYQSWLPYLQWDLPDQVINNWRCNACGIWLNVRWPGLEQLCTYFLQLAVFQICGMDIFENSSIQSVKHSHWKRLQ